MSSQLNAVGAHLVGGLQAPDAESAMRTAAGILGNHLHAITDGETGERSQWVFFQVGKLTAIDGIQEIEQTARYSGGDEEYARAAFPSLSVDPSVTELPPRALGYADAAEASYATFVRLRDQGVIADDVKFQVSLPTPYAPVTAWLHADYQERFMPVYANALEAEANEIARVVGDDLFLQYDVAMEFAALTGSVETVGNLGDRQVIIDLLRDTVARAPEGCSVGVHLCYGDWKNRHFAVPQDLSLCVDLANAVIDHVDLVHMPVDRETGRDPAYFEALRDLKPTRLALGVVDYDGDEQRTDELVAAAVAGSGKTGFMASTECGMAQINDRGATTVERLLELHARVAEPLR